MLICDGGHSLRYRDGLEQEKPAIPGKCYQLKIELASTAISILPGHQLRVEITSSCLPRYVRNLNSGKNPLIETEADAVTARQKIHHSEKMPSKIILPIL
jgi:predicted acyl esterase